MTRKLLTRSSDDTLELHEGELCLDMNALLDAGTYDVWAVSEGVVVVLEAPNVVSGTDNVVSGTDNVITS